MRRRTVRILSCGLVVVAIAIAPITGCSMGSLGGASTYGGKPGKIANISSKGNYTADAALSEARSHFRNNDFGYSAAYYKKYAELSPKNAEGYIGLGASYDRLGRFDLSDRVYASLYKITGGTAQYFNNVGYSYMLRGNLKSALKSFRKASRIDPDNIVINNNMLLLADAASAGRA